jgi:acyl-CoA synthetase (AMP-forming)/AMP-acid ligase II
LLRAAARDEFCPWYWVQRWSRALPHERAIIDESGELTWRDLREQAEALSVALPQHGLVAGCFVVLIAENSRFLVTALLAIQRAGGCPVLLDPASDGHWLAHAVEQSGARLVWVARQEHLRLTETIAHARVLIGEALASPQGQGERTSAAPRGESAAPNKKNELPSGSDPFALLLTSGSTAKPRLVRISNHRAVLSGYGIGHVCMGQHPGDTVYCALPVSHATALVTGLCVSLVTGCALALRAQFSAAQFWPDVARLRATSALYLGEIARRLLAAPASGCDRNHQLRVLYGTGMPLDVWHRLQARFGVRRILEFYGATELPIAMVNLSEAPGYMGRIALRELSPWQIARLDAETNAPRQDGNGSFELSDDNEPGELVFLNRYRTGDLVVRDADGYVRYLDRQPGVFRQNGHNTSSHALRAALLGTPGVRELGVTHVTLPRYDGQCGLVVVVAGHGLELAHLQAAYQRLPKQQRPRFLRVTSTLQLNRGLKFDAVAYARAGVDPGQVSDPLYLYGPSGFVAIDSGVWRELQLGTIRF